jgi:Uma2 family endonuclease
MGMAIAASRITVKDLNNFPDDGHRYELLDGQLLVTPFPQGWHQVVANRLQYRLSVAVDLPGHAFVVGPGVVVRPPRTQLQPDILVTPSRFGPKMGWDKITENWLAVEVLNDDSRVYDRELKRDAYFALGVHQVWLVDRSTRCFEVSIAPGSSEIVTDVIRWRVPTLDLIVSISLEEVFAGL